MLTINKDYMIFSPKEKVSKSGKSFTEFTVSDSIRQADGTYKNEYYKILVWECPPLEDRQKVSIEKITGINCYVNVANGKTYFNKDVTAILNGQNEYNNERLDNNFLDDDEDDKEEMIAIDDLPF